MCCTFSADIVNEEFYVENFVILECATQFVEFQVVPIEHCFVLQVIRRTESNSGKVLAAR